MALLTAEVIEAKVKQTATLIFLHGLGDNGAGWASILRNVVPPHCKVICPNAKEIPVTLNFGMVMPAWYDLFGLSPNARQDETGIIRAANELGKFVEAEKNANISPERIVVGGFSQGGSAAYYYALTNSEPRLGGLVALSSWLPLHSKFLSRTTAVSANRSLPVFQCHGLEDPVVPYELGELSSSIMKQFGFNDCSFNAYPKMGHFSSDKEMNDVKNFLSSRLPEIASRQVPRSFLYFRTTPSTHYWQHFFGKICKNSKYFSSNARIQYYKFNIA
nr:hypothetical transcript [Hymenolepis microstoma]